MGNRYIYQVGGSFRFVKLFDKMNDAIEWVRVKSCPSNWQSERENHAWGNDNILADLEVEIQRKDGVARRVKSCKLFFRATCKPRFTVNDHGIAQVKRALETMTPEEFADKASWAEVHCVWEAKIEACLRYVELLDEVKVAGEPYQPAREQEGESEWYPVHKMVHNDYEWRLSIDPTPREMTPRGRRDYEKMKPTEYWHRMSGNMVSLTTTED